MKLEILAPAGSMESLIAGVRCGANAVYLGTQSFNARRNAGNFDDEELKKAVTYCHERGVKVYLTLNTLVSDSEMKLAYDTVKYSLECGVDAFIVQDLGVAKMIKEHFNNVRLHASTQTSVMTPKGVETLKNMGFSRVVLPREMTKEEILEIRKSTDIELEMFVHGALCMSVSGQCYLSSMIGTRSGNRGLCAQPCRLAFSADNSGSCDLSLKDNSLIRHINEIKDLSVTSLKIEGRMKRPEYVAASVCAVKSAIDNNFTDEDEKRLMSVFSRSGFTDGYFKNNMGSSMFGTRRKEDVVATSKELLKSFSHLYDNETPLVPVEIEFISKANENSKLIVKTDKKTVEVIGSVPEKAINKPMSVQSVTERISKLGGTPFYAKGANVTLDDGLIIPASSINAMRREACEKLLLTDENKISAKPFSKITIKENNNKPYFTARFLNVSQIPSSHSFKRIFIPIWSNADDFIKFDAGVEIPRGLFGKENETRKKLAILKDKGVKNALCSNLGSYYLAKEMGFNAFGDFSLNIYNSYSASQFNSPILSFEQSLDSANKINANDTGLVVYGRLPMMLTRNCPIKSHIGCENCKKNGSLTDRKGYVFPVICSPYPCTEMLNCNVLYMGDRKNEIKTDFLHFYFTLETKAEVIDIIKMFENGEKANFDYTRGLYQRGVM